MERAPKSYLPAAGLQWLLPLYDPIAGLLGMGSIRRALLDQAAVRPGDRVLDIGCGTGTLAVGIKRLHSDVEVFGVDPDPKALARAERKAQRHGVSARFDEGFADHLPYADASFDVVFSSLMLHHLAPAQKAGMLREVRRILAPTGSLHLVDFAGTGGFADRLFDLFHEDLAIEDNAPQRILDAMCEAGLERPGAVAERPAFLGRLRIVYYRASAPALAAVQ